MKVTAITQQVQNKDRVNIMIDGQYRFSLDVFQVGQLGLKVGHELTEEDIAALEQESQFGKLYVKTLDWLLSRPHSGQEVREYLRKKTHDRPVRRRDGKVVVRQGVPQELADRVYQRLEQKGYIDDAAFARHWAAYRHQRKGVSQRKLALELRAKGIAESLVRQVLAESGRSDTQEIDKVIAKKAARYAGDRQKFIIYLQRQGFYYDDIILGLERYDS